MAAVAALVGAWAMVLVAVWWVAGSGRRRLVAVAVGVVTAGASVLLAGMSARREPAALVALTVLVAIVCLMLVRVTHRWRGDRAEVDRLRTIATRNADQISIVSHEIRTPLALMRGSADLLAEESPGPLNDIQRRYTATISRNCDTVIALAEDLLTQARIDAGMFELHPEQLRMRPLAAEVIAELRALYTVPLAFDCPGRPPVVWADSELIRQALINLVNNAVAHATNATLVTLRIVDRDHQVLVSVTDNGDGIDDEARKVLFERFASGRPLRDGTGLGLVITRQIVQMHGGSLLVDSASGGGTTMMFTLPTRAPDDAGAFTAAKGHR